MHALINAVDKANGYCFGSVQGADQSVFSVSAGVGGAYNDTLEIQEKYGLS